MMKRLLVPVLGVLLFILAACGGTTAGTDEPVATAPEVVVETAGETMSEEMADETMDDDMGSDMGSDATDDSRATEGDSASHEEMADESMDESMADSEEMAESSADMMQVAAWQTLPLVDARTGETFSLADFSGQTVLVEPMATWCSNCRQQLTNVQQARTNPATNNAVFIALSVETSISNEELAQYADQFGFDWTFAVMTPDLLQALADEFGRSVANPPSTPHFVINPDGSFSELFTGLQSADEIVALAGG